MSKTSIQGMDYFFQNAIMSDLLAETKTSNGLKGISVPAH